MKITICGSMAFAKEMLENKKKLEQMGHTVFVASDAEQCVTSPNLNMDVKHCSETDVLKEHFNYISKSDAILVLNHKKNGIKGYVGGSTLMEIAVARHLDKKIFFHEPTPDVKDLRYAHEIQMARPVILGGDLSKIS
jgi:hypothetical protein